MNELLSKERIFKQVPALWAVEKNVEVVEIRATQRVEDVENLVEVVDNSLYQDLLSKSWKS